jgi:hypothetical protein
LGTIGDILTAPEDLIVENFAISKTLENRLKSSCFAGWPKFYFSYGFIVSKWIR